jgi:hypothetical protein
MASKLYVGNLGAGTTDEQLKAMFERFGPVTSARVVMDATTGKPKGFGFVEMSDYEGGRCRDQGSERQGTRRSLSRRESTGPASRWRQSRRGQEIRADRRTSANPRCHVEGTPHNNSRPPPAVNLALVC